ncbi:MAG: peptidoglycan DD-metalloendopeptidase family protein [Microbacterium arborescens]
MMRARVMTTAPLLVALLLGGITTASADAADPAPAASDGGWILPLPGARVVRGFDAPAHEYAPGHRGVDLAGAPDATVLAPASGVVAFAGQVAGRAVMTIDHGDGTVSSLEPVETILTAGAAVSAGSAIGSLSPGGHVGPGTLHLGARHDGEYVDPMLLLGGVPRAVLLPCC